MRKILLLAAATAVFAACTSDEAPVLQNDDAPRAVAFDTYTSSATRSGQTDVMSTTTLHTTGFGIFAFQSDNATYAATDTPDFMWNQEVTWTEPSWIYTPLKYWPNETTQDTQDGAATSTGTDVLSFFAYAPYVAATPGTGAVTATAITDTDNAATPNAVANVGITGLTSNAATGDPKVSYQMAYTPSKSVDLLWGVAPAGGLSYQTVNPDNTINIVEGTPLTNLIKPSKDQKIKFLFKHALARLGMTVVAAVDQLAPGGSIDAATKIYVNSVTITNTAATIPVAGELNLNNTTTPGVAKWESESYTIPTGGLKLVVNSDRGLNEALTGSTTAITRAGVTTSETNVIADGKYFMLIPTHADAVLQVTIDYTVITADANVAGEFAVTNNVITKEITISSFTNNKAYNLRLVLGLTSVKVDAEVADWQLEGSSEVNLPRNNN